MSRWYGLMYKLGLTPWEDDHEAQLAQLRELLEPIERRRGTPYGSALDLGCGTGRYSVELAERGWQVVGVDVVPKAIELARERARIAKVDPRFVRADVTRLATAGVGQGFSLVLDAECFNHLGDAQRVEVGRGLNAVTGPEAEMLILVWRRARRGPLPPGASRDDLLRAFPEWRIAADWDYQAPLPPPLKRVEPRWYLLTRV